MGVSNQRQRDAAAEILRGMPALPGYPAEFGRPWGFTAGESARLVRTEQKRREKALLHRSPTEGTTNAC